MGKTLKKAFKPVTFAYDTAKAGVDGVLAGGESLGDSLTGYQKPQQATPELMSEDDSGSVEVGEEIKDDINGNRSFKGRGSLTAERKALFSRYSNKDSKIRSLLG